MDGRQAGSARWAAVEALGVAAFVVTVARGLDRVSVYALGHWMLSYRFGYVKRGLVGTLVRPLLLGKQPPEVQGIVTMLATLVFVALAAGLLVAARRVSRVGGAPSRAFALVALAFLTSSGVIVMASTFGYLDHVLACVTLLGTAAAARQKWGWAAVCGVLGLAAHELFLLYGLPVVAFALLARVTGPDARRGDAWRALAALLPAAALLAFVVVAQSGVSAARVGLLRADLLAMHTLDEPAVGSVLYQVQSGFGENLAKHLPRMAEHLLDPRIGRMAAPAMLASVGAAAALLAAAGRGRLIPVAVLVAVAPLAAHAFAQDTTRFTAMAVVQAFLMLHAVVRVVRPPLPGLRARVVLGALALVAIAASLTWRVPLMGRLVDGRGMYSVRAP